MRFTMAIGKRKGGGAVVVIGRNRNQPRALVPALAIHHENDVVDAIGMFLDQEPQPG